MHGAGLASFRFLSQIRVDKIFIHIQSGLKFFRSNWIGWIELSAHPRSRTINQNHEMKIKTNILLPRGSEASAQERRETLDSINFCQEKLES